jgi:hypothetical protein
VRVFGVNASSLGRSAGAFPNSPRAFANSPLPFCNSPIAFWKGDGGVADGAGDFGKRKGGVGVGGVAFAEGEGGFRKGEVADGKGAGRVGVGAETFSKGGVACADGVAENLDCGGITPLLTTRHVASFQSADVSAHSKLQIHNRRVAVEREGAGAGDF